MSLYRVYNEILDDDIWDSIGGPPADFSFKNRHTLDDLFDTKIEDLEAELAAHEAAKPDWREAKRLDATREVRLAFEAWVDKKENLTVKLTMLKDSQKNRWVPCERGNITS